MAMNIFAIAPSSSRALRAEKGRLRANMWHVLIKWPAEGKTPGGARKALEGLTFEGMAECNLIPLKETNDRKLCRHW